MSRPSRLGRPIPRSQDRWWRWLATSAAVHPVGISAHALLLEGDDRPPG